MKNLITAMSAVMGECGYIQKTGYNSHFKYSYVSEGDLLATLHPSMVKHGLILIPSVDGQHTVDDRGNTWVTVAYTLAHVSGEVWPHPIRAIGCGNDKVDKGVYKALTGANKYLLFKLFQVATGDDPEQDAPPPPAPVTQGLATKAQLDDSGREMARSGMTPEQGKAVLERDFAKASRLALTEGEMNVFLTYLRALPSRDDTKEIA